eukprot:Em0022g352a
MLHVIKMNRCKFCTAPVLNSKERRRLESPSSESCRQVLIGLAVESGAEKNDASQEYGSGYLCFNTVAKFSALKGSLLLKLSSCSSLTGPTNRGLADRLSKVADVPVAPDDGLAKFICGICNRKFLLAESFIATAKASYEKSNASPSGTGGTIGSQAQVSRKRTKDTSGPEASPHTTQCRPVAKRLTAERPGRRLTYPDCHNSQTDNCTEPLSDSSNDQGPGTTDGPGNQELDVIGAPNVSQNPVEHTVLDPLGHHASTSESCRLAHLSVKVEAGNNLTPDHSHTRPADVLVQDQLMSLSRTGPEAGQQPLTSV